MGQLEAEPALASIGLKGETDSGTGWSFVFTENGLKQLSTQDITFSFSLARQFD